MSATINETIEILADLVQIHQDRILHYEHVSKQLINKDIKLEALITRLIGESYKHKLDLTAEIQNFGIVDPGSVYKGKVYKEWLEQKTSRESNTVNDVLHNCRKLEEAVQNSYKAALEEELEPNAQKLISTQLIVLSNSCEEIKSLNTNS